MTDDRVEAEKIAHLFHETYEELAPSFGYETRKESAVPWEQVPENNRNLMIAVAARVAGVLSNALDPSIESLQAEVERLRKLLVEEREENLWNAFNSGHIKEGEWTHMFMSDGEWLARECGLDPRDGYYPEAEVRAKIPQAARQALAAKEQTR